MLYRSILIQLIGSNRIVLSNHYETGLFFITKKKKKRKGGLFIFLSNVKKPPTKERMIEFLQSLMLIMYDSTVR